MKMSSTIQLLQVLSLFWIFTACLSTDLDERSDLAYKSSHGPSEARFETQRRPVKRDVSDVQPRNVFSPFHFIFTLTRPPYLRAGSNFQNANYDPGLFSTGDDVAADFSDPYPREETVNKKASISISGFDSFLPRFPVLEKYLPYPLNLKKVSFNTKLSYTNDNSENFEGLGNVGFNLNSQFLKPPVNMKSTGVKSVHEKDLNTMPVNDDKHEVTKGKEETQPEEHKLQDEEQLNDSDNGHQVNPPSEISQSEPSIETIQEPLIPEKEDLNTMSTDDGENKNATIKEANHKVHNYSNPEDHKLQTEDFSDDSDKKHQVNPSKEISESEPNIETTQESLVPEKEDLNTMSADDAENKNATIKEATHKVHNYSKTEDHKLQKEDVSDDYDEEHQVKPCTKMSKSVCPFLMKRDD